MAFVARTTLLVDKGDKTVRIPEGSEVKKSSFDDKVWDTLLASGSVAEVSQAVPSSDREAELEAQVKALQEQLAAVQADQEQKHRLAEEEAKKAAADANKK